MMEGRFYFLSVVSGQQFTVLSTGITTPKETANCQLITERG
jgi:hypothetical protein